MTRNSSRAASRPSWLRRLFLAFLGVTLVVPVLLILLARFIPPVFTPLMLATWITEGSITRQWMPLSAISPNLVRAVIASEDDKFCSHYGFDFEAIDKALASNA